MTGPGVAAFPLCWPTGWPRAKSRSASPYRVRPGTVLDDLYNEVRLLGGASVVISSNAPVRRDGRPYAEAIEERHLDPGAAVYFARGGKPAVIACDRWLHVWENLRAISKTIEALRQIERTGASELLDRAFLGFRAIEGPRPWHVVLGVRPDANPDEIASAHRRLAMERHPDRGGSAEAMAELNAARDAARGDHHA